MATQVRHYVTTIAPGTHVDGPYVEDIDTGGMAVTSLGLYVPPGPSGVMGFAIYRSGQIVLPYNGDSWFIWDDIRDVVDMGGYPSASGWQVVGYNVGTYEHSIQSTWTLSDTTGAGSAFAQPPQVEQVATAPVSGLLL